MSIHDGRITHTTIEVEKLRLAALLANQPRSTAARAGLTPHDAAHTALRNAILKSAALKSRLQAFAASLDFRSESARNPLG